MINRSQLKEYEANPTLLNIPSNSKFFYSSSEASDYARSLGNVVHKTDQWQLILDDIKPAEEKERQIHIEQIISERVGLNESQAALLRSIYITSVDIYSVSLISDKSPQEFYSEGYEILLYDDEINGATPINL